MFFLCLHIGYRARDMNISKVGSPRGQEYILAYFFFIFFGGGYHNSLGLCLISGDSALKWVVVIAVYAGRA